jgi:four helix bundle protein
MSSNYRATCRARSKAEFISKIGQVVEEADESQGWLAMLVDNGLLTRQAAAAALQEANELTAIFAASLRTAKENLAKAKAAKQKERASVRKSSISKSANK